MLCQDQIDAFRDDETGAATADRPANGSAQGPGLHAMQTVASMQLAVLRGMSRHSRPVRG